MSMAIRHLNRLILHALRHELGCPDQAGHPLPARTFVQALAVSPAAITHLLRAADQQGLMTYHRHHGASLTDLGRHRARLLLRRHRLIETYFQRALGLDWSEVHDEAARIDEALSDRVIERMAEVLGHPQRDPHGDAIPDAAGCLPTPLRSCCRAAEGDQTQRDDGPLSRCAPGRTVALAHVVGHDPALLRLLGQHGIRPETTLKVTANDPVGGTVTVATDGLPPLTLARSAAALIHVVGPPP